MSGLPTFRSLAAKTIVVHTVTYFVMGLIASKIFDYAGVFARPELAGFMRQLEDPVVALGPALQPIRGLIFALVLYPLRDAFFARRNGWLVLWWTLVGLGILSPFGTGGVEALIYTTVPPLTQLVGLLEIVAQAFLLSAILTYWTHHPEKRWLKWTLGVLFVMVLFLSIMGFAVMLSRAR